MKLAVAFGEDGIGLVREGRSGGGRVGIQYKVVELSEVTDEAIEEKLNEWTGEGWRFDTLQFAMRDSSKRPAMAFLIFTREEKGGSP